jgi:iron complex outermembrane receptor protein
VPRSSALTFTDAGGVVRTTPLLSNAAKSRIRGIDLQAQVKPVRSLEIIANLQYLDAKFVKYITLNGQDLSNRPFAEAPKWSYTVGLRYHLPVDENLGRVTISWNTQHKSKNYFEDQFGTPFEALPGHYVSDARVDWKDVAGYPFDIGLYMKNVFDREYRSGNYSAYGAAALGFQSNVYADPRTYGVSLRYRFGD